MARFVHTSDDCLVRASDVFIHFIYVILSVCVREFIMFQCVGTMYRVIAIYQLLRLLELL